MCHASCTCRSVCCNVTITHKSTLLNVCVTCDSTIDKLFMVVCKCRVGACHFCGNVCCQQRTELDHELLLLLGFTHGPTCQGWLCTACFFHHCLTCLRLQWQIRQNLLSIKSLSACIQHFYLCALNALQHHFYQSLPIRRNLCIPTCV